MAKHREVTEALRGRLLSGDFEPGMVLPTTQELAAQFETSVFTVQTAMAPLVEEGFLERRRNVGTIVKHNPAVLTCAGIYCSSGLLDEWEYAFYRELCRQLQQQLAAQGIRAVLYTDMRPEEDHAEPLPELLDAVENHRIQALFVALTGPRSLHWLKELPVTSSFVTSAALPNTVAFDTDHMLRLALEQLRNRGCGTVGLISSIQVLDDPESQEARFYRCFHSTLADLALATRDSWVMIPDTPITKHESYGFEACRELLEQSERPDGLFVYPDTSSRGAIMALLALGVRVPRTLKVVSHRNTGVDWMCPLAVDWVIADVSRWAAEMIEQVRQQKNGKDVKAIRLPFKLQTADVLDPAIVFAG